MPGKQKGHGHTSHARWYAVTCPTCGARAKRHCHSKGKDNWTVPHKKRIAAVLKKEKKDDGEVRRELGLRTSADETSGVRDGPPDISRRDIRSP